jgi:hypothetical protein
MAQKALSASVDGWRGRRCGNVENFPQILSQGLDCSKIDGLFLSALEMMPARQSLPGKPEQMKTSFGKPRRIAIREQGNREKYFLKQLIYTEQREMLDSMCLPDEDGGPPRAASVGLSDSVRQTAIAESIDTEQAVTIRDTNAAGGTRKPDGRRRPSTAAGEFSHYRHATRWRLPSGGVDAFKIKVDHRLHSVRW